MAGQVAGYKCPHCGFEGMDPQQGRPIYMLEMHFDLDGRSPLAMDLKCGVCMFEWREFLFDTE